MSPNQPPKAQQSGETPGLTERLVVPLTCNKKAKRPEKGGLQGQGKWESKWWPLPSMPLTLADPRLWGPGEIRITQDSFPQEVSTCRFPSTWKESALLYLWAPLEPVVQQDEH